MTLLSCNDITRWGHVRSFFYDQEQQIGIGEAIFMIQRRGFGDNHDDGSNEDVSCWLRQPTTLTASVRMEYLRYKL